MLDFLYFMGYNKGSKGEFVKTTLLRLDSLSVYQLDAIIAVAYEQELKCEHNYSKACFWKNIAYKCRIERYKKYSKKVA